MEYPLTPDLNLVASLAYRNSSMKVDVDKSEYNYTNNDEEEQEDYYEYMYGENIEAEACMKAGGVVFGLGISYSF